MTAVVQTGAWAGDFIFGMNTHFRPSTVEHPYIRALGADMVRLHPFGWHQVEKTKGVYQFGTDGAMDRFVENLYNQHTPVFYILCYSNPIYTSATNGAGAATPPLTDESVDAFANYAAATVGHYQQWVDHWEIWNEPDLGYAWTQPDAAAYTKLAVHTAKKIREVQPNAVIAGPAISSFNRAYLDLFFSGGGGDAVDVLSLHNYPTGSPESGHFLEDLESLDQYLNAKNFKKPLWITETGYATAFMSETEQARYTVRTHLLGMGVPRLKGIFFYDLRDDGDNPRYREHSHGMMFRPINDSQIRPKLAYWAYQFMTRTLKDATFESWISKGNRGIYAQKYSGKNERIATLWAPASKQLLHLKVSEIKQIVDMYGQNVPYEKYGTDEIAVSAGPSPIYLRGGEAMQVSIPENNPVMSVNPPRANVFAAGTAVTVTLMNPWPTEMMGEVRCDTSGDVQMNPTATIVRVPTGKTQQIEFKIKPGTSLIDDGVLSFSLNTLQNGFASGVAEIPLLAVPAHQVSWSGELSLKLNPENDGKKCHIVLNQPGQVSMALLDDKKQRLKTLFSLSEKLNDTFDVAIPNVDQHGQAIPAGEYLLHATVSRDRPVMVGRVDGVTLSGLSYFGARPALAPLSDGSLVVACAGTNSIQLFDAKGNLLAAGGQDGPKFGEFITGVERMPDGTIVAADWRNSRLLTYRQLNGKFIYDRQIKLDGQPLDTCVDEKGRLLAVLGTAYKIVRLTSALNPDASFGHGGAIHWSRNQQGQPASMPTNITVDTMTGTLYVGEQSTGKIVVLDGQGKPTGLVFGDEDLDGKPRNNDTGVVPGEINRDNGSGPLAFDAKRRVLLQGDYLTGRIQIFDTNGNMVSDIGLDDGPEFGFGFLTDIQVCPDGTYMTSSRWTSQILRLEPNLQMKTQNVNINK